MVLSLLLLVACLPWCVYCDTSVVTRPRRDIPDVCDTLRRVRCRTLPEHCWNITGTLLDGYVNGLFILAGKIKHITY